MSLRRILAIAKITTSTIFRNPQQLMMPAMALAIVIIGSMYAPDEMKEAMPLFLLTTGISINVGVGSVFMSSLALAEEKEHNTLNALMTSSVSSNEYIIGSLLPPFIVNIAINAIIIHFALPSEVSIPLYLAITTLGTVVSLFIGMIVGIFSKSQMSCYSIVTPVILVLGMIPIYSTMNDTIAKVSDFIYVGGINTIIADLHSGAAANIQQWIVMVVWLVASFVILSVAIKKKGLEG